MILMVLWLDDQCINILKWSEIDQKFMVSIQNPSLLLILSSLIPYIEEHLNNGGKSWDICKHLINLVEGIPKAKV